MSNKEKLKYTNSDIGRKIDMAETLWKRAKQDTCERKRKEKREIR